MTQPWFDVPLKVDEAALRGGDGIVMNEQIATIVGESSLSLWRDEPVWLKMDSTDCAVDLSLRCVAHAHPESRFRWVHLTADFSRSPGVIVSDLSPRDEVSDHPVKVTTTYKGGISFDIAAVALSPEIAVERTREQDIYFPILRVSGIHLHRAIWTFEGPGEQPLHIDRNLRLLLAAPAATEGITMVLTMRAKVVVNGLARLFPLLGRRTVEIRTEDGI
jgi:hypothetical protein